MSKNPFSQFEMNQLRLWQDKKKLYPHIESWRKVKKESKLLKIYFVVVILLMVMSNIIYELWASIVSLCFSLHWAFLYLRNHKRKADVGKNAEPVINEYKEHVNKRADVVGVDRPYKKSATRTSRKKKRKKA